MISAYQNNPKTLKNLKQKNKKTIKIILNHTLKLVQQKSCMVFQAWHVTYGHVFHKSLE